MSVIDIYHLVSSLCLYSAVLIVWLTWKNRSSIRSVHVELLFFLACLICYLIFSSTFNVPKIVSWIFLSGSVLSPLSFWLLSRALFAKKKISKKKILLIASISLIIYYGLAIWDEFSGPRYPDVLIQLISLGYIVLGVLETQKNPRYENPSTQFRLKKLLVFSIAIVALFSIVSELALYNPERLYVMLVQRVLILSLVISFINNCFSIKSNVLGTSKKEINTHPTFLAQKIKNMVESDRLYRLEKLTIRQLSEELNEHEYKVRQAINQDLGYRNFLEFVNSFRIKEAVELLQDPSKVHLTVLEIAYYTGFNSIGPFNRTFKAMYGVTPTAFRKDHLQEDPILSIA